LSTHHQNGADISNDNSLPCPYPSPKVPPLLSHSFAALGWIGRAGQAVGSDRFAEAVTRASFNIDQCAIYVHTPAEKAVLEGLLGMVDGVVRADAEARELLGDSVSGMADLCADEVVQVLESAGET
jgi:hypothetical protein